MNAKTVVGIVLLLATVLFAPANAFAWFGQSPKIPKITDKCNTSAPTPGPRFCHCRFILSQTDPFHKPFGYCSSRAGLKSCEQDSDCPISEERNGGPSTIPTFGIYGHLDFWG